MGIFLDLFPSPVLTEHPKYGDTKTCAFLSWIAGNKPSPSQERDPPQIPTPPPNPQTKTKREEKSRKTVKSYASVNIINRIIKNVKNTSRMQSLNNSAYKKGNHNQETNPSPSPPNPKRAVFTTTPPSQISGLQHLLASQTNHPPLPHQ